MLDHAKLILEDGSVFEGISIGAQGVSFGEVVFNTSMTGYQEILSDPSYARQIVTLTYPHIGNVGTNIDDQESTGAYAAGLIIRDLPIVTSNWRSEETLSSYLKRQGIVAIAEIDTRDLTQRLREKGALRGAIVAGSDLSLTDIQQKLEALPSLAGCDLAKTVTTKKAYNWDKPTWTLPVESLPVPAHHFRVVVVDFGVKQSILRALAARGCQITVVPAQTTPEEIRAYRPDGVLFSNGPGDPEPCDYAIQTMKALIGELPLFGICLGFQLLSLAIGAKTQKMKFGHHGGNHPVQCLNTKRVLISSQNHGFCVDESALPDTVAVTHRSLFDGTLQGWRHQQYPIFGFQGHPEAGPGPFDVLGLFDEFISDMNAHRAIVENKTELCQKEPT